MIYLPTLFILQFKRPSGIIVHKKKNIEKQSKTDRYYSSSHKNTRSSSAVLFRLHTTRDNPPPPTTTTTTTATTNAAIKMSDIWKLPYTVDLERSKDSVIKKYIFLKIILMI